MFKWRDVNFVGIVGKPRLQNCNVIRAKQESDTRFRNVIKIKKKAAMQIRRDVKFQAM